MDSGVADSLYSLLPPSSSSSSSHLSSSHLVGNQFFLARGQSAAAVKLLSQVGQEELIKSGSQAALDEDDTGLENEILSAGSRSEMYSFLKMSKSTVIGREGMRKKSLEN